MSSHGAHAASVAPAVTGNVFGGFSTQRLPSFFRLSKNQKKLVVGSLVLRLKCTSGGSIFFEDDFSHLPIAAGGRFGGSWSVPLTKQSDGSIFAGSGSMTGHLDRRDQKLHGTWRVRITAVSTTGQADQCDSGVVRFTALQ